MDQGNKVAEYKFDTYKKVKFLCELFLALMGRLGVDRTGSGTADFQ